ncbi:MAG: peptidylprolyl isomerase [Candidatus Moranbacteria bacterium]|nr:peptidylprolyl isomerase [Candidatus Moranbacteria bacterium]
MFGKRNKKSIPFGLFALLAALFLSGCYDNQPKQGVLRNAEQYDIRNYQERQTDNSPAAHRLSVNTPQGSASAEEQSSQAQNQANQGETKQLPAADEPSRDKPAMQIDQNKKYSAVVKTGEGDISIDFSMKKTPITVNNFIALARENFYSGLVFHRVMKGFMIQGGDPNGDGSGGPGYKFEDERLEGKYTRGTVAMANSGPNSNGSQFFIVQEDYDLPNKYVIFGHVSKGMDTVDKIANAETVDNGAGEKSKPVSPVKIKSVEIIEK